MEKVYIDYFKEEPCKDCNAIENCKSLGIECALREHYIDAMPKQEAIEKMAKEIYKRRWIESECKDKNTIGFSICKDYAEIALNALLQKEK